MAADHLPDGPVRVMLAKAQATLPGPAALAGGTVWELKFDGYRAVLRVTDRGAELWSRNGSDLSPVFPDLVGAAAAALPVGLVADGEAVVWVDGRLSFDHLQQRMAARGGGRAGRLARQHPATFVAFDLLAANGEDLRPRPWRERRAALEQVGGWRPPLQLSPYTDDYETAVEWFRDYPGGSGVEGLMAKGAGSVYQPDVRGWIKIKSRENLDCVIGAVIGPVDRPEAVVAGRYTAAGVLRIVGRTGPLTSVQSAAVAAVVVSAPVTGHPWPAEISSGHFGGGTVALTRVGPAVVVEVAADPALTGNRPRHILRFVRLRPDLDPANLDPID